ncbi:MAG: class I SAM-dependent methyltransferase [Chloroflexi bacterium]|nr:class I SAM-dependent methyltransferase [Chloroflexota bacterium]
MAQEISTKDQFEFVFNAFRGLQTVQVISLGLQTGMLAALDAAEGGLSDGELAEKLSLHPPYVRLWCQTAYAFHVLEMSADSRYQIAPKLNTVLLDQEHPRYLGGFAQGFATYLADDFQRYPEAFSKGTVFPFWERGEHFSAWVSGLTHPLQRLVVGKVLPELFGDLLQTGIHVLDVGCGAGRLIFKLAESYPHCRFVGIDADAHGIAIARKESSRLGLSSRVTFRHVRGEQLKFESEFDLALMFEVFHELPVSERASVLTGCYRALRPGGQLFIVDETWPESIEQLRDPAYGMSIMVQFSELVWGNLVATESEQTRLLHDAGFRHLKRGDIGGTFTTILAQKPLRIE